MALRARNKVASIVLAAGRGSRMTGFDGNKATLPLIPSEGIFVGKRPFIEEILSQLPRGPRAIVIHHDAKRVIGLSKQNNVVHIKQPVLNGTGGAVLAARGFMKEVAADVIIITMGDVPLVRAQTYENLLSVMEDVNAQGALIAFRPQDKKRYGCLVTEYGFVKKIIEWQYWKDLPADKQAKLELCNSGIYAFNKDILLTYLDFLAKKPHRVEKTINGRKVMIEEYFLTDLIEWMVADGHRITFWIAPEYEVIGVDTPDVLREVQLIYGKLTRSH